MHCFGSVFSPDPDQTFFLSLDPDRTELRIRSGKIRIRAKKRPITRVNVEKKFILFFGQAPPNLVSPKPYQNHHLDHISL